MFGLGFEISKLKSEIPSQGLFHNFGDHKQAVGLGGGVAQGVLVGHRRADLVRAEDIDQRDRVGGRLDLADVQLLELFNVTEDVIDLRAELFLFGGGQGEPREIGHIFDIYFSRHGKRVKAPLQSARASCAPSAWEDAADGRLQTSLSGQKDPLFMKNELFLKSPLTTKRLRGLLAAD